MTFSLNITPVYGVTLTQCRGAHPNTCGGSRLKGKSQTQQSTIGLSVDRIIFLRESYNATLPRGSSSISIPQRCLSHMFPNPRIIGCFLHFHYIQQIPVVPFSPHKLPIVATRPARTSRAPNGSRWPSPALAVLSMNKWGMCCSARGMLLDILDFNLPVCPDEPLVTA